VDEQRARALLPPGLAIAILAISTSSIFIRLAQGDGVPSLAIAAARLGIASLVILPLVLTRHRSELRRLARREWLAALLAGLFLALHFAAWVASLEYTSVASSVVIVTTSPLWVALLGSVFLHEKTSRSVLLGMGLALVGGVVIGVSDACSWQGTGLACPPLSEFVQGQAMWGNFLALAGAWAVAGYFLVGRSLRAKVSLAPYIFLVYSAAAIFLLGFMLFSGASFGGYQPETYLWLALLALVPQLVGHTTYNWALRYLPASLVAIATLGEPVGSTILAYLFLQEDPGWLKIGGGALILAGIWLAARKGKG